MLNVGGNRRPAHDGVKPHHQHTAKATRVGHCVGYPLINNLWLSHTLASRIVYYYLGYVVVNDSDIFPKMDPGVLGSSHVR